jgi:hypothetical protein
MIPQLPSSVLPARPCSTFQQQTDTPTLSMPCFPTGVMRIWRISMVLVRDILSEWVVDRVRKLRGRIGGGSWNDKKPFRMAVLEGIAGLESSIWNQLHVKQYIDHALNSFKSHSHLATNTHILTPGDTNQLLRWGGYSLHTSSQRTNKAPNMEMIHYCHLVGVHYPISTMSSPPSPSAPFHNNKNQKTPLCRLTRQQNRNRTLFLHLIHAS